jgi:hypothetical protein
MSNSQHQRELHFIHAHDAPPVVDLGKCYDAEEVAAKMKEYGHKASEIKMLIGGLSWKK